MSLVLVTGMDKKHRKQKTGVKSSSNRVLVILGQEIGCEIFTKIR